MFYSIARWFVNLIFRILYRLKTIGSNNIPKDGGLIIAMNHRSNWDPVFSVLMIKRRLSFISKKELFENKFFGWFLRKCNAFPVSRGTADLKAVKWTLSTLKSGGTLLMFPEGTRVKDGREVDAKTGVAMFALKAKVPIVPAVMVGKFKLFHKIQIIFGEPIYLEQYYDQKHSAELLKDISDDVLDKIRKLKPAV